MQPNRTPIDTPAGRPAGLLLGLTGALLALLILNLAVFDDLRTDPSAGVLETFTKPQHLSSLLAVLLAAALVAFRHRSAARVAAVVAWIEIAAFTFFHGIPVDVGPSKPYWGDGMGDALQWVGSCRSSPAAQPSSTSRGARRREPPHRSPRASPEDPWPHRAVSFSGPASFVSAPARRTEAPRGRSRAHRPRA